MMLIINIECLYGVFLTVILNAVKLSVIKVSVNILSVVAPFRDSTLRACFLD
jgi:hypothetical protein